MCGSIRPLKINYIRMKKVIVNSPRIPVYRDSGFELTDAGITADVFNTEKENIREPDLYIYSRYRNPTVVAAEEEIIALERCNWALLTQSGMSAIDTAVSAFQQGKRTKPWLFFSEIYGGTLSFCESVLRNRRGIDIQYLEPAGGRCDLGGLENMLLKIKPEFFYLETISNPLLMVVDIPEVIRISKKHNVRVIVDNTFATPYLFKPLDHGADIVLHSATKYLSGHGNVTAGVICGNDPAIMKSALEYRKLTGHMMSPDDAYRLNTQVKTFRLRFSKQCENAKSLAEWLHGNRMIEKVFYPGLNNHSTHSEALKLFGKNGFGAMITIDFAGWDKDEKRKRRDIFIKNVSHKIKLIPTLGDPDTILMPVESVWGAKYPEPGMIRLSIGFEEFAGLQETISTGLNSL
jgi:cystathionine beta-lyase/cystathionine gamma-synthase